MAQKRDNWVWSVLITVGFISVICGSLWSLNDFIERENGDLVRLAGSAYLVGSMCIIAIAGRLLFKANAVWLLCFISLPLGLIWSANELLTTLSYVADPSHLPFIATNVMLPTFVSGLVCALAFFLMSEDEESETKGNADTVKICGFIAGPNNDLYRALPVWFLAPRFLVRRDKRISHCSGMFSDGNCAQWT